MPTLAVPLRDMVMEQIHADRLILSGGHGDNDGENADIHMFTRSTRGDYARTELMMKLPYQFSFFIFQSGLRLLLSRQTLIAICIMLQGCLTMR